PPDPQRPPPIATRGSTGPPTRTPPFTPRCEAFAAAVEWFHEIARFAPALRPRTIFLKSKKPRRCRGFFTCLEDLTSARQISVLGDDRLSPVELVVHANQSGLDIQTGRGDRGGTDRAG